MKTFTIRFVKAPSYRKVIQTVIRATDKRNAMAQLRKKEGAKNRLQVLYVHVSE